MFPSIKSSMKTVSWRQYLPPCRVWNPQISAQMLQSLGCEKEKQFHLKWEQDSIPKYNSPSAAHPSWGDKLPWRGETQSKKGHTLKKLIRNSFMSFSAWCQFSDFTPSTFLLYMVEVLLCSVVFCNINPKTPGADSHQSESTPKYSLCAEREAKHTQVDVESCFLSNLEFPSTFVNLIPCLGWGCVTFRSSLTQRL